MLDEWDTQSFFLAQVTGIQIKQQNNEHIKLMLVIRDHHSRTFVGFLPIRAEPFWVISIFLLFAQRDEPTEQQSTVDTECDNSFEDTELPVRQFTTSVPFTYRKDHCNERTREKEAPSHGKPRNHEQVGVADSQIRKVDLRIVQAVERFIFILAGSFRSLKTSSWVNQHPARPTIDQDID